MTKIKRPTSFKLGTFNWAIKYLNIAHDVHGETLRDSNEIHIITRGKSEQTLKDTLLHECLHVVLTDVIETTSRVEDKCEFIEEQIIRLITPRVHELFTNNKSLRHYLFGK